MTTLDPAAAPAVVQAWLERARPLVEAELERRLATTTPDDPGRIAEAMRYATLGPGKRLRPAVTLAACQAAGGDVTSAAALAAAASVELCHAYSLVHDDLPAMDDDDERRGKPTVHVAFGEGNAILVGDALLTMAFACLADLGAGASAGVGVLGRRAGVAELIGGQARDLAHAGAAMPLDELERMHAAKTGALFAASAELGGIAAGASAEARGRLARYGLAIGIAFQHADDRDDGEQAELAAHAATRMRVLCDEACELARAFGAAGTTLEAIAAWIGARA